MGHSAKQFPEYAASLETGNKYSQIQLVQSNKLHYLDDWLYVSLHFIIHYLN